MAGALRWIFIALVAGPLLAGCSERAHTVQDEFVVPTLYLGDSVRYATARGDEISYSTKPFVPVPTARLEGTNGHAVTAAWTWGSGATEVDRVLYFRETGMRLWLESFDEPNPGALTKLQGRHFVSRCDAESLRDRLDANPLVLALTLSDRALERDSWINLGGEAWGVHTLRAAGKVFVTVESLNATHNRTYELTYEPGVAYPTSMQAFGDRVAWDWNGALRFVSSSPANWGGRAVAHGLGCQNLNPGETALLSEMLHQSSDNSPLVAAFRYAEVEVRSSTAYQDFEILVGEPHWLLATAQRFEDSAGVVPMRWNVDLYYGSPDGIGHHFDVDVYFPAAVAPITRVNSDDRLPGGALARPEDWPWMTAGLDELMETAVAGFNPDDFNHVQMALVDPDAVGGGQHYGLEPFTLRVRHRDAIPAFSVPESVVSIWDGGRIYQSPQ